MVNCLFWGARWFGNLSMPFFMLAFLTILPLPLACRHSACNECLWVLLEATFEAGTLYSKHRTQQNPLNFSMSLCAKYLAPWRRQPSSHLFGFVSIATWPLKGPARRQASRTSVWAWCQKPHIWREAQKHYSAKQYSKIPHPASITIASTLVVSAKA